MSKKLIIGIAVLGALILINILVRSNAGNQADSVKTVGSAEVVLPEEVSTNFPTYPNTKVSNTDKTEGGDGRIFYSLRLEARSSVSEINVWYRDALSTDGWSIKSDRNIGGYQLIQAEKDNLFTSVQAAKGEAENTSIVSQQIQIRN